MSLISLAQPSSCCGTCGPRGGRSHFQRAFCRRTAAFTRSSAGPVACGARGAAPPAAQRSSTSVVAPPRPGLAAAAPVACPVCAHCLSPSHTLRRAERRSAVRRRPPTEEARSPSQTEETTWFTEQRADTDRETQRATERQSTYRTVTSPIKKGGDNFSREPNAMCISKPLRGYPPHLPTAGLLP